jgi:hypothetical protein
MLSPFTQHSQPSTSHSQNQSHKATTKIYGNSEDRANRQSLKRDEKTLKFIKKIDQQHASPSQSPQPNKQGQQPTKVINAAPAEALRKLHHGKPLVPSHAGQGGKPHASDNPPATKASQHSTMGDNSADHPVDPKATGPTPPDHTDRPRHGIW